MTIRFPSSTSVCEWLLEDRFACCGKVAVIVIEPSPQPEWYHGDQYLCAEHSTEQILVAAALRQL